AADEVSERDDYEEKLNSRERQDHRPGNVVHASPPTVFEGRPLPTGAGPIAWSVLLCQQQHPFRAGLEGPLCWAGLGPRPRCQPLMAAVNAMRRALPRAILGNPPTLSSPP